MMADDIKPFACPMNGCGMQFTNEDHLTVHKKKHEMSLNLTPSTNFRTPFVDQTPTPTRFIKLVDEVGLFQDLHHEKVDNPFDEQFRKAAQAAANGHLIISQPSPPHENLSEADTLHTPSIQPVPTENDLTVSTTSSGESSDLSSETSYPTYIVSTETDDLVSVVPNNQPSSTSSDTDDDSISLVLSSLDKSSESQVVSSSKVSNDFTANGNNNTVQTTVVPTPVITSLRHIISNPLVPKVSSGVPTAVVVSKAVTQEVTTLSAGATQVSAISESKNLNHVPSSPSVMQPSNVSTTTSSTAAPLVQFILRLPNGHSMPVQIPVVTVATTPLVATAPAVTVASKTNNLPSLAKIKLKEALTVNQKPVAVSSTTEETTFSPAIQVITSENCANKTSINGNVCNSQSSPKSGSSMRRRRDSEDDPDEKRRKFLERNRAAATRCRKKRKHWIQSLEKKAEELSATNNHLQNEVTMLRNEVAQLKTMLLAHKDCPITLQQQAAVQCDASSVTTVSIPVPVPQSSVILPHVKCENATSTTVINSSGDHINTGVTMDIIEVEVSSSQYGNALVNCREV